jgi:hypothetical protein
MSSAVRSGLKAYPPSVFWDTPGASTSKDVDVRVKRERDYISPEPPSPSPSPSAIIDPSGRSPSPVPSRANVSVDQSPPRYSRSPSIDELQDDSPPPPSIISSRALPPSATRPYMPPGGRPIIINTSFEHNILPPLQPLNHSFKSESSPSLSSRSPQSRAAPYPSPILSRRDGLQSQSPKAPYDTNAALVYGHASISNYSPLSPLPPIKEIKRDTVTTTATQAASANRRRNEAHFLCPVPGCGSTFTRRFNLRGAPDPRRGTPHGRLIILLLGSFARLQVICGPTSKNVRSPVSGQAAASPSRANTTASACSTCFFDQKTS